MEFKTCVNGFITDISQVETDEDLEVWIDLMKKTTVTLCNEKYKVIAELKDGKLRKNHYKIIYGLRAYYIKNGIAPMVRTLSKITGCTLKTIYDHFPAGPGAGACRTAGIPKPSG